MRDRSEGDRSGRERYGREWYGSDWLFLRNQFMKLAMRNASSLLDDFSDNKVLNSSVSTFMRHLQERLIEKTKHESDEMWRSALPLIDDHKYLLDELVKDQALFLKQKQRGIASPSREQRLGQKLWQFFERARRQLIADKHGVSLNKVKTWERLNKISIALIRSNLGDFVLYSDKHFEVLAQEIKVNYAKDKNLPRRLPTIKDYFSIFSDPYIDIQARYYNQETYFDREMALVEKHNLTSEILGWAISQLDLESQIILDLDFGLEKVEHIYKDKADFLTKEKRDEVYFDLKLTKAKQQLEVMITKYGLNTLEERL